MLPQFRNARVIARYSVLNGCRNRKAHKRWIQTKVAAQLEPAYLHNPGHGPLLEKTIGSVLGEAARRWPDREVFVSLVDNQRLTNKEVLTRVDRIAAGLKLLGLQKGDRLGLWGPNDLEWYLAYLAGIRAGLIVATINPSFHLAELDYCLRKIGARAVIAPETSRNYNYAEMLVEGKKNLPDLEHIIIYSDNHVAGTRRMRDLEALPTWKDVEAVEYYQSEISPYDGANIQFTSGTTGTPKAALISHRSLVNNFKQGSERVDIAGRKICLNVPFFHAFGMGMGIIASLHAGATLIIASQTFNPVKSVEAILKEKCSVAYGTPTMWINMIDVQSRMEKKIDTLYTGVTGGAPCSPQLYKRIREALHFDEIKTIYGLTETTAIVNQSLYSEPFELTNTTIGYISDHIEIKVIDNKGEIVPFGTAGELCVRGYSTMIGYFNDEKKTKETFTEDKWLKTGDQYILNKNGYGYIVGRLKDMLIRGGENIFPKEIENFLESHPLIIEAYAFGVYDEVYGEEICACLRLREGANLTPQDIVNYAKGKIAHFKIPRYILFRDDFPKTSSGKIQKFKLKMQLEDEGVVPKEPKNIH